MFAQKFYRRVLGNSWRNISLFGGVGGWRQEYKFQRIDWGAFDPMYVEEDSVVFWIVPMGLRWNFGVSTRGWARLDVGYIASLNTVDLQNYQSDYSPTGFTASFGFIQRLSD